MTPDVVVDIGNSRMKWGRCENGRVAEMVSLPLNDSKEWSAQSEKWNVTGSTRWAVGGVSPQWIEAFLLWILPHGGPSVHFTNFTQLPIRLNVDKPKKVGLDRLFGAIAAHRVTPPGEPAITVDAGTAVTVNLIDRDGVFQGGAIFPGPHLMAKSLYLNTAKLPHLEIDEVMAMPPLGRDTTEAIQSGIAAAVTGGVSLLVTRFAVHHPFPWLYLTGGSRGCMSKHGFSGVGDVIESPHLNLEGIRIAAEALP